MGAKTQFLRRAFRCTGLLFGARESGGRFVKVLRQLRAYVLLSVVACHLAYSVVQLAGGRTRNPDRSVVFLCWGLQAFMSICFVVYWQHAGCLRLLLERVPWTALESSRSGRQLSIIRLTFALLLSFSVAVMVMLLIMNRLNPRSPILDPHILAPLGGYARFASYAVHLYAIAVWITTMTMYSVVLVVVQHEVGEYNSSLSEIGVNSVDRAGVAAQLADAHDRHVRLCELVALVDRVFNVFVFCMLGTNIPTTIFTLLSCYRALEESFTAFRLCAPGIVFCLLELAALTWIPARISAALTASEQLLYVNRRVWQPYDEQVHCMAALLLGYPRNGAAGISVWGFAIVSKPIILTTASLVFTYLTLLIELSHTGGKTGSALSSLFNDTMLAD